MPRYAAGLLLVLGVLQTASAGGKDESAYSYATVAKTCGEVDNPELVLTLTERPMKCDEKAPGRFISLFLDGWSLPQSVDLPEKNGYVKAYKHEEKADGKSVNEPAVSGSVTIDHSGRNGHYELTFKDSGVVKADFQLRQCMRPITCP
jgi:hypothetical protein